MQLKELKEIIDKAVENAGHTDPKVEVWFGDVCYDIDKISQFQIVPDVIIKLKQAVVH